MCNHASMIPDECCQSNEPPQHAAAHALTLSALKPLHQLLPGSHARGFPAWPSSAPNPALGCVKQEEVDVLWPLAAGRRSFIVHCVKVYAASWSG